MRALFVVGTLAVLVLSGCVSEDSSDDGTGPGPKTPAPSGAIPADAAYDGLPDYRPLPETVTKLTPAAKGDSGGGQGVWLWNDRAYISAGGSDEGAIVIFDISQPEAPVEVGRILAEHSSTGGLSARDVDILNYGNRTVVAMSQGGPMVFFDVTDPSIPVELARFEFTSHNLAVHRPAHVVYNSRSLGNPPGGAEIIDASDPSNIKLHKNWEFGGTVAADGTPIGNTGCHDVMVYPEVNRAYCAAVTQTLIWDITDPLDPEVLTAIDNPFINIHHSAFTILNHSVLVIGDEYGGAAVYACYGQVSTPVADASTPTGAIWFYDLTTPVPTLMSWLSPPAIDEVPSTCTAHFGSEIGDGTGYIAYGWYNSGTLLVDAKDPMFPRLVSMYDSGGSTWDARYYRGYVFTGDGGQGMGVLRPE